ncbi:hypothetical protein [Mucilaginibacter sp. UR6-11]|uniref:hypothetical protein n=1 Tax=Mucilaginibacter sp. UR6-11 TaxID=1435644 RepID=UPI001E5B7656|nr:hypothetical protein [Mucilaginibacter sp. UR6-11]MCC8426085.1 hypothetical protein [Mucilaginibacter sp. UR6-11]
MKQETLLTQHLQNKFDELPINGNATADWKKLEMALQITMPIALFWKLWLSKKFLWISMIVLGGSGITALVVYQTKQANITQTAQPVKPIKNVVPGLNAASPQSNPTPKISHSPTVIVSKSYQDTPAVQIDTVPMHKHKTSLPTRLDTVIHRHKTPLPTRLDTTIRKHKTAPYARPNGTLTYHN